MADDDDDVLYKPQTPDTRAAYEALLAIIAQQLGAQPPDVLAGAADELLTILKDDHCTNNASPLAVSRKEEVGILLTRVSDATFQQLVSIARRITDFHHQVDDDHQFVAVEFAADSGDENEEPDDENDSFHNQSLAAVDVHDIDAYWLHRKIWHAIDNCGTIDPQRNNQLAEKTLKTLAHEGDDMELETRLVVLFDYANFDLVRFLLGNRYQIVWATRLARAQEEQRNKIEEQMRSDPRLAPILQHLRTTT